jgi:hypothetical protein
MTPIVLPSSDRGVRWLDSESFEIEANTLTRLGLRQKPRKNVSEVVSLRKGGISPPVFVILF